MHRVEEHTGPHLRGKIVMVASMRQNHRSVAWGPASRPSPPLASGNLRMAEAAGACGLGSHPWS